MVIKLLSFLLLLSVTNFGAFASEVVCYFNSKSLILHGQSQMTLDSLDTALNDCTYLIYGFATVNKNTGEILPENPIFELVAGSNGYSSITHLKHKHSNLKVLLSVGGGTGDVDDNYNHELYLGLLEHEQKHKKFISSAYELLKAYEFDGIDLAFQLPKIPVKKTSFFGLKSNKEDDNEDLHQKQFTKLVEKLKIDFSKNNDKLLVSLTVLPLVNSTAYYDVKKLIDHVDLVNLLAFDFHTPTREGKYADYTAPLKELVQTNNRLKYNYNANYVVSKWTENLNENQKKKIILGIPTYGRTWKLTTSKSEYHLPLDKADVDGPGEKQPYTKKEGLLSFPEICTKVKSGELKDVHDPDGRAGTFAFKPKDGKKPGILVSYESEDSAKQKANYVRQNLGGIAVYDLSLDDFKGLCNGQKYRILKSVSDIKIVSSAAYQSHSGKFNLNQSYQKYQG